MSAMRAFPHHHCEPPELDLTRQWVDLIRQDMAPYPSIQANYLRISQLCVFKGYTLIRKLIIYGADPSNQASAVKI